MEVNGHQDLHSLVSSIQGLRCWYVSCGGCTLPSFQLALGEKVERRTPLKNPAQSEEYRRFKGEASLLVWCSWRLDAANGPLTSSDDTESGIVSNLDKLIDATIESVAVDAPAWDLSLRFSDGLTLRVFCDHVPGDPSFDGNWELSRQDVAVYVGPGALPRRAARGTSGPNDRRGDHAMNGPAAAPPQPAPPPADPLPRPPWPVFDPARVLDPEYMAEFTKQLPETDGMPMDSPWHRDAISLLIAVLTYLWRGRDDFYVGGNMFIYYSVYRVRNEDIKGPDFFYVAGADRRKSRQFWAVWEEDGKYPDLIIELLSPTTAHLDRTAKKAVYENTFRTPEYFCYDPATQRLEGWRLQGGAYEALTADERGWMWSEVLQMWLGLWTGEYFGQQAAWLRFYDSQGNLVLHQAEAAQHQAEAARRQADAAEAELARLKAWLAQKGLAPEAPNGPA